MVTALPIFAGEKGFMMFHLYEYVLLQYHIVFDWI